MSGKHWPLLIATSLCGFADLSEVELGSTIVGIRVRFHEAIATIQTIAAKTNTRVEFLEQMTAEKEAYYSAIPDRIFQCARRDSEGRS